MIPLILMALSSILNNSSNEPRSIDLIRTQRYGHSYDWELQPFEYRTNISILGSIEKTLTYADIDYIKQQNDCWGAGVEWIYIKDLGFLFMMIGYTCSRYDENFHNGYFLYYKF